MGYGSSTINLEARAIGDCYDLECVACWELTNYTSGRAAPFMAHHARCGSLPHTKLRTVIMVFAMGW